MSTCGVPRMQLSPRYEFVWTLASCDLVPKSSSIRATSPMMHRSHAAPQLKKHGRTWLPEVRAYQCRETGSLGPGAYPLQHHASSLHVTPSHRAGPAGAMSATRPAVS